MCVGGCGCGWVGGCGCVHPCVCVLERESRREVHMHKTNVPTI